MPNRFIGRRYNKSTIETNYNIKNNYFKGGRKPPVFLGSMEFHMKIRIYYVIGLMLAGVFLILTSLTILPEQELFGWYVFLVFIALFLIQKHSGQFLRALTFVLAAFLATRYILFRAFFTLQVESPIGFWFGLILFFAELFCLVLYLLNMFVNIEQISRKTPDLPEKLPSIDVFIPTYNEEEEVAYTTALACLNFDYPAHLVNIYILNDGGRLPRLNNPELTEKLIIRHRRLSELAAQAGVHYLTREDGEKAKAGMLNAALKGEAFKEVIKGPDGKYIAGERTATDGELILILDCDHIPTKDFLKKVVGHFNDKNLALVQTPHFMINPDPMRKNTASEEMVPDENWLFYFGTQRGLDRWGASYFCGSAAMLRRSALKEVGWLSGDTITEDAETALTLHASGYESVYVDTPMVAGLAPESFDTMIRQRIRWCQGMLQILILKNPLFYGKMSLAKRLCYLSNCLYWIFPIPRVIFLLSPLMFLFFNINIYNASISQVINFGFPYLLSSAFMFVYMFGKKRLFFQSEVSEMMQAFFLLPAIFSVILSPKKPTFVITTKGITSDKDEPSPQAPLFLFFFALVILGFVKANYLWLTNPLTHEATALTVFWDVYNFIILLCCLGIVWERKQRRHFHRITWHSASNEEASLDGHIAPVKNLSASGFALEIEGDQFSVGQNVEYSAANFNRRAVITKVSAGIVAGYFIETDFKDTLGYVYGDSHRWQSVVESFSESGSYTAESVKSLIKIASSSLLCLTYYLTCMLGYLKKRFFSGAALVLLCLFWVGQVKGETTNIALESLLYGSEYVLAGHQGELQIPFYLPKRIAAKSATFALHYSRLDAASPLAPEISMSIDSHQIPAQRTGNAQQGMVTFVIPEEKLVNGHRTAVIAFRQQVATPTTIDLKRSSLTVNYELSPLGSHHTDLAYLFEPELTTPKILGVVLEKNDESHIKRALKAVQNISIRLVERPLHISVIPEADSSMDCLLVGDTFIKNKPTIKENATHALLTEDDLGTIPPSRRTVLEMGSTMTFEELGLGTVFFRQFSGPRFTDFIIPSAIWLTPNHKLKLLLKLIYSADMPPGASLDVMVNQEMFANIRLHNQRGEYAADYAVEVPISLLNNGVNRLWLKPNLSDNNSQHINNDLYVAVFAASSIHLPKTDIHVRIPDLNNLFADGYPFVGDSDSFLQGNSDKMIEAYLNFAAIIGQKRGTVGKEVTVNIKSSLDNLNLLGKKPTIFAVAPDQIRKGLLVIDSQILDEPQANISLAFKAHSAEELSSAMKALWSSDLQQKIAGTRSEINFKTGEVANSFGPTVLVSNILPVPSLAFYASNYPRHTAAAIAVFLLAFSVMIWFLLRKGEPKA